MQSSPKRSESASTATRPAPCSVIAASGAPGGSARLVGAGDGAAAVAEGDRAGAVEAGLVDAGEQVGGRAVGDGEVGEDPGRGLAVVLVVLHGGVLDREAETGEQLVEVVAVLVLLGLAEDDETAAGLDEARDRLDLGVVEPRGAAVESVLPLRVGGVGDDEDVGAGEGLGVERGRRRRRRPRSRGWRAPRRRRRARSRPDGRAGSRPPARDESSTPRSAPRRRGRGLSSVGSALSEA